MNDVSKTKPRHTRRERAWRVAAVVLLIVVGSLGCNPIQMMNFVLTPFADNYEQPECPLTIPDKESKVVIIATQEVLDGIDMRDSKDVLCQRLGGLLQARFKEHKDKVTIVPCSKVQAYLNKHPDWVTQPKRELGREFKADFVVFLEMGPMTLYKTGSHMTLYQGNVEINIAVIDVNADEDEGPKFDKVYSCTYPPHGEEDASSMSPQQFKQRFLDHVAKDLLVYFAAHETNDKLAD
jgi:hypothetical protein